MESLNFEFLRTRHPELADLGGFAETYVFTDPSSALVKLRTFGETLVAAIFQHYRMPRQPQSQFIDFLTDDGFKAIVPPVILDKFHALRIHGNRAAHGDSSKATASIASTMIKEAFDLAKWFGLALFKIPNLSAIRFQEPPLPSQTPEVEKAKDALLRKLAEQEAAMQRLLEQLDAERAKVIAVEKTKTEQLKVRTNNARAADQLQFDEDKTRKLLIDQMLVAAGWKVENESNDEVGIEVPVEHQPTDTGTGYADYVLWGDDGKPLAVVEAKKTVRSADEGREQAKLYADGLENAHGQRPVIFYTNGHDVFIWNDARGEVPRRLYGFYSKDSLVYCIWKTKESRKLADFGPRHDIVDRLYQIEAIKRVCERFDSHRRKALLVQATGTGKTRVAISLCELLIRAHWVKRVLFLCDRRELRKQANNTFGNFLPGEPKVYVSAATASDRNQTFYLATYPAMMKCYENFDVGFFDLIIADESHRSIYNRYRDIFNYFDALEVGLTATPVQKISRNTFIMFDCENSDPTAHYSYNEAIDDHPPYLVPFRVTTHTTKFLREGIRYADMTPEQQAELEDQVEDAEKFDISREQVDKSVFNKDTDRKILRNLMENGVRDGTGSHVGKTIIFARNHEHAIKLQKLFEELYPQYMKPKQEFCAVIDNYMERAEQLIDDFKGEGHNPNLFIAISVDMLDTGIDVPEIVNLVFAKPVHSYVKFWQMIGRGTRLCKDLFAPGEDKKFFRIFDHWGNFEYFGENPPEYEAAPTKSLLQKLFEKRLAIAEKAIQTQDAAAFAMAIDLVEKDINAIPQETIAVREKWRQHHAVMQPGVLRAFGADTVGVLRRDIAKLMQWRPMQGYSDAYQFDFLIAKLQCARLTGSADFDNLKDDCIGLVSQLPINLSQVAARLSTINQVKDPAFWQQANIESFEKVRVELRGIMNTRNKPKPIPYKPLEIDVTDISEVREDPVIKLDGLDLAAYRTRVESVLNELFDLTPVLRKIKQGIAVTEAELRELVEKVLLRDPDLNVEDLIVHFPNKANRLDLAIRQVIGLDGEKVNRHFLKFAEKYPNLNSHQIRFLEMIKKHIANYGAIEIEKLYETPFTQINSQGLDGVFTDEKQINDLLNIITEINGTTISAN